MKILFSLIALVSLVMGQFASPLGSVNAQSADPTATLSETVTETPTVESTTPPVENPTESITPTVTATRSSSVETPTASPTAAMTETLAATGTVTAAQTPTTTATSTPASPVLTLRLTPDFSTPSGKITVHWEITGTLSQYDELALMFTFPAGVQPEIQQDAVFNEETNTLTFPVTNLKDHFAITTQGIVENTFITAALFTGNDRLTETSILLSIKEQFEVTSAGGEISAKGGKIRVKIPADTFNTDTIVEIGDPNAETTPPYSLSGQPFEIKAKDKQDLNDLHQLGKRVEIYLNFADLDIPEEKLMNLFLYWYNPDTYEWEALPSFANPETKILKGYTDHFSVFSVGVNDWQAARTPTVDDFQVSQFTGAATFSLPIEVPPGPGGLQPNFTLTYNSQVVDQSSFETQASWVGMGWSLETGSIEINTAGTAHEFDDTYFLNVGGISSRLVRDETIGGLYHAADENFWKFEYDNTAKTWTVWDKTGNKYYFEQKISLRYLIDCDPGPNGGGGDASDPIPYKWVLTRVQNIYGQELQYTYVTETKVLHGEHYNGQQNCMPMDFSTDTAIYPESIVYPHGRYRIYFDLEDRLDYPNGWVTDAAHHSFERQRLENIYTQYAVNGTFVDPRLNASQTVKQYRLTYESNAANVIFPGKTYPNNGRTSTLSKVEEFGVGGVGVLPAHTFIYGDNLHMTQAKNGYGGAVEFVYESEPWYYEPATIKAHTFLQPFDNCPNVVASGWAAGNANSSIYMECENGHHLAVSGRAIHNGMGLNMIRPGAKYRLSTVRGSSAATARFGASDGQNDHLSAAISSPPAGQSALIEHIFTLPETASTLRMVIQTSGGALGPYTGFGWAKVELLPSFYRVTQKKVSDGQNHTYTYSYSYTGAAVNDWDHSKSLCSPSQQDCNSLVEPYSEFRGHSQVTETGPAPYQIKTITTFGQDDQIKGLPTKVLVKNSAGLNLTETIYLRDFVDLPMKLLTEFDKIGFDRYWVYPTTTETILYNSDGNTIATQTQVQYTFNPTGAPNYSYGNLLRNYLKRLVGLIGDTKA